MNETLESAVNQWKLLDLPTLQKEMNDKIEEIKTIQIETLKSRKDLSNHTKRFKKLNNDDKLVEIKSLLKQYQVEIDKLTNRSKLSEDAFSNVYRSIHELNDPIPFLEKGLDDDNDHKQLQTQIESKDIRINQLINENRQLMKQLNNVRSSTNEQSNNDQQLKINELESENVSLVSQLDQIKLQFNSLKKSNESSVTKLKRDYEFAIDENSKLKTKLEKYKDYEDIKQELIILRSISFGDNDDEVDDDNHDENQLDEILLSRNKKLTAQVVEYRAKHESLTNEITTLSNRLNTSTQEIDSLKKLNNQLENDLTSLQIGNHNNFDTTSIMSGVSKFTAKTKRLSPASSIAGGQLPDIQEDQANNSVLPIVTSQRDRFRSRNIELESQLKKQNNITSELISQINKLKKQNEELFEKIRYLSSFQKGSVKRFDNERQTTFESNYEENLHPLAKFRQREQERVASKLSPLERIFLSFAKAILANKTSRMLFLGYCVGLHCLVMAMSVYVMSLHGNLTPDVGGNVKETSEMIA